MNSPESVESRPGTSGDGFDRRYEYHSPDTLDKALQLRKELGYHAMVIAGGTDVMVDYFEELHKVEHWLDLNSIDELRRISVSGEEIRIGSMATHRELATNPTINELLPLLSQSAAEVGSWQIRSRGTVGGNAVTASPAGDTLAPLMAHDARFVAASTEGRREIKAEDFFTGPKQNSLRPSELLTEIVLPRPETEKSRLCYWEKVGKRNAVIISSVTIAVELKISGDGRIERARPCYGAVAPTPVLIQSAAEFLQDKNLIDVDENQAGELVAEEVSPIDDIRGTEEYRRQVSSDLTIRALRYFRREWEGDS